MSHSTPDAEWFYSLAQDSHGPVTLEELRQLIGNGTIGRHHFVRHITWDRWWSVDDSAVILGLPAGDGQRPVVTGRPSPEPVRAAVGQAPGLPGGLGGAVPPFGLRILSWSIDGAALVLVFVIAVEVLPGLLATLTLFAGYVGYTIGLPLKGFDTAGHKLCGLSVRCVEDGGPPTVIMIVARSAVVLLLAVPCALGLIASAVAAFASPRCRSFQDAASGTITVKTRSVPIKR